MDSIGSSMQEVTLTTITKLDLLKTIKTLKGSALEDAVDRADSLGSYYREDKRQKRGYIEEITRNMWTDNPGDSWDIDNNLDVLYIVKGISKYSHEASRFSQMWYQNISKK